MINRQLYYLLQKAFGSVVVMNADQPFRCSRETLPGGRVEVHKLQGGEEYAVNCPACGDTRKRLYINHMYGTRVHGVLMESLFHCYNEGYSCRKEVYYLLEDLVSGVSMPNIQTEVLPSYTTEQVIVESAEQYAKLKGEFCVRMDQLAHEHPAYQYMLGRQFDPVHLGQYWGCYYAQDPNRKMGRAYKRIIIPLIHDGVTVGYQARAIPGHSPTQTPKYWTASGCKKSFFLGGYDYAKDYDFVVICEGPTKKWRIGTPAVDILGSSLSDGQVNMLVHTWKNKKGPIVFVSDPGMEETWGKNATKLAAHIPDLRRVVVINPRWDAGDMDRGEIRRMIVDGCARQGCGLDINSFHS